MGKWIKTVNVLKFAKNVKSTRIMESVQISVQSITSIMSTVIVPCDAQIRDAVGIWIKMENALESALSIQNGINGMGFVQCVTQSFKKWTSLLK